MRMSFIIASLATSLIGLTSVAHAVSIVSGSNPDVGTDFRTTYGNAGYILFNNTPAGTSSGAYTFLTDVVSQSTTGSTNTIVLPSYVTAITGITGGFNSVAGFGYSNITTGLQAGLSGPNEDGGGNIFSFTLGAGAPSTITFGVLTNYSDTSDQPASISLTSGIATATVTVSTTGYFPRNNLFTITGATAGDVFTISVPNASYIAGATFDPVAPTGQAVSIVSGSNPAVGTDFRTTYGNAGYILFNNTPAGTNNGAYTFLTNVVSQSTTGSTNTIVLPSYVTAITGTPGGFNSVAGYGFPNITTGLQAGLSGPSGAGGGNILSFTLGTGAPSTLTFGVLTNYSQTADQPTSVSLTSGIATATATVSTTGDFPRNNLFTITGATAGDVFTVSVPNAAYIAGVTFDPVATPIPEPLLTTWRSTNFPGSTATTGPGANDADFDEDGLANLVEYALGTDAKVANASPVTVVNDVTGVLTLSFPHIADATVVYTVKATNDLAAGFGSTPVGTFTGYTTPGTTHYLDTGFPLASTPKRFLRLEVSAP